MKRKRMKKRGRSAAESEQAALNTRGRLNGASAPVGHNTFSFAKGRGRVGIVFGLKEDGSLTMEHTKYGKHRHITTFSANNETEANAQALKIIACTELPTCSVCKKSFPMKKGMCGVCTSHTPKRRCFGDQLKFQVCKKSQCKNQPLYGNRGFCAVHRKPQAHCRAMVQDIRTTSPPIGRLAYSDFREEEDQLAKQQQLKVSLKHNLMSALVTHAVEYATGHLADTDPFTWTTALHVTKQQLSDAKYFLVQTGYIIQAHHHRLQKLEMDHNGDSELIADALADDLRSWAPDLSLHPYDICTATANDAYEKQMRVLIGMYNNKHIFPLHIEHLRALGGDKLARECTLNNWHLMEDNTLADAGIFKTLDVCIACTRRICRVSHVSLCGTSRRSPRATVPDSPR